MSLLFGRERNKSNVAILFTGYINRGSIMSLLFKREINKDEIVKLFWRKKFYNDDVVNDKRLLFFSYLYESKFIENVENVKLSLNDKVKVKMLLDEIFIENLFVFLCIL